MFRRDSKPQNRIDSLIGATTRVEGNVFFSGGLRIDGAVRGNVTALPDHPGTLVVSENGRIEGEVRATHIVVNGMITGAVNAEESLELQASCRINGDVHYLSVEMVRGALVDGRMVHHEAGEMKPAALKLAARNNPFDPREGSGRQ